jgi:hypothetical protein
MNCESGSLQGFLDGELKDEKLAELLLHLKSCPECRKNLASLRENQAFTDQRLESYLNSTDSVSNIEQAWLQFKNKQAGKTNIGYNEKGGFKLLAKYRIQAVAAVVVLGLAVSLSFSSVRAAAGELLSIFRVEKIQTVDISPADMERIERALREGAGKVDLSNLGKIEFIGKSSKRLVTLQEATETVDFQLKLPAALPEGYKLQSLEADSVVKMNFTLDTDKTNAVLKGLGSPKLLPAELNGKTFSIIKPAIITAEYKGLGSSIILSQARSPELITPDAASSLAIRDALLALPFLPNNLRNQLAAIDDWQHTFPIPNIKGSSQEVRVAGTQGVLIAEPAGNTQNNLDYNLIWQQNGVVYALSGDFTVEQALEIADSLK